MDGSAQFSSPPAPPTPPRIDWADLRRFAEALRSVDRDAVPREPLARDLHLAVAELDRPGLSALPADAYASALAPLHLVLSAFDATSLAGATSRELVQLIVLIDDAKEVLETPDLRPVVGDQLAARLRELYAGIVRTRAASTRLHRAWTAAAPLRGASR
jgi:hypothetical protein